MYVNLNLLSREERESREETARRVRESQERREAEQAERQRLEAERKAREDAEFIERATTAELVRFVFGNTEDGKTVEMALCHTNAPEPKKGEYQTAEEFEHERARSRFAGEMLERHQRAVGPASEILKYRMRFQETWSTNADKAVRRLWRKLEMLTLGYLTLSYPDVIEREAVRKQMEKERDRTKYDIRIK